MSVAERRGTVYVVDDDLAFRTAIGRLLDAAGYLPRLYASAAEYLAAATDESDGPACVLLDLRMPGLTGLELQEALAGRAGTHPIIFLSGHGDIPSTVRAMRAGAVDFLTKPVPTRILLDALQRALERDLEAREQAAHIEDLKARYASLTRRERQVMEGAVAGHLNRQTGAAPHAAERTTMLAKMKACSIADLVHMRDELVAAGVPMERPPRN